MKRISTFVVFAALALATSFVGLGSISNHDQVVAADAVAAVVTGSKASDKPAPYGLEKRTFWTTSRFQGRPEPPPPYRVESKFPQLSFEQTVLISSAPGSNRLFVGERKGKIFSIVNERGCDKADLFVDTAVLAKRLSASSPKPIVLDSLYGLCFDPDFEKNRYCYVCYVARHEDRSKTPEGTRVSRLTVSKTDPPVCDMDSEKLIISWLQGGHNGGCVKFGNDGYLYVSSGDGGIAFPPDGLKSGQNLNTLLSKVLRIDVHPKSGDKPYAIPSDNPYVGMEKARGETWVYGLRNPWKMSFDKKTGDLWIGDVGWELWELVYKAEKGANYGWSIVEGRQPVHNEGTPGPTPIIPPTIEIPHVEGASVTGGFVYRGKQFPELEGQYIFGDWETRRMWATKMDGNKVVHRYEILDPIVRIVDFAEDADGELYLLDHDSGAVFTLARNNVKSTENLFPRKLSDTGLFKSVPDHAVADGVLPFSINAPAWADYATGERFMAIPGKETIKLKSKAKPVEGSQFSRQVDFPLDTVAMKTLSLELVKGDPSTRKRIETQVLHFDGREFQGYTYEWNDAQTDAVLVERGGKSKTINVVDADAPGGKREQTWWFGSRGECIRCHNPWSEWTLAFSLGQLNRPHNFGSVTDNQIRTYRHIGLIEDVIDPVDPLDPYAQPEPPKTPAEMPKFTDPMDASADINARARTYLHVNCALCHRFNGGGSAYIYLTHDIALKDMKALGVRPTQGTFGIHEAQIVAPGDPYRSVMYFRLAKTGPGHMPHLGSKLVHPEGAQLIHDWIRQLPVRYDDILKVEQLASLDEAAALAAEAKGREHTVWLTAQKIGKKDGREAPNAEDLKLAETSLAEKETENAVKRAASRPRLIKELLATPPQAMLLAMAVKDDKLPASIRAMVLETALGRTDPAIVDLFEIYVPESQRVQRLGEKIQPEEILKLVGDVARGRQLFHESTVVQCRSCHKLENRGNEVGSDLSQVGKKYDRAKILENILQPSLNIDAKYVAYLIETTSGQVHTGLIVKRDDKEVILRDAQNKEHKFAAADIEGMYPQRKSLMPDLLLKEFTAEQVADLLAYLSSLK